MVKRCYMPHKHLHLHQVLRPIYLVLIYDLYPPVIKRGSGKSMKIFYK
jgi:hypothetical protein